ncbi:acetylcholine receptor subunit beta-type acr-3-like [Stegodyphus dumicola]|uniref:acetylcholine receptor subunit beta-type acr-3-like n=1 Tax=Stegodyphus dumicola TaxID=202533 RepID=UPI0015B1F2B4|nr:acetylcholine receptor subunit beta-type acr-3-like [Stegodyphus dumicola]
MEIMCCIRLALYSISCLILYSGSLCIVTITRVTATAEIDTAASIRQRVLKDYDKTLSPAIYSSVHYTYIGINVLRVRGLDEVKGELILEAPIVLAWTDERLTWESDTVKSLRIPSEDIWVPSLNILNRIEPNEVTNDPLPRVLPGGVWWVPRYVLRTSCIPNLKYYPFDAQICDVVIVSVSHEGDLLEINYSKPILFNNAEVRTESSAENLHWQIISADVIQENRKIDYDTESEVGIFRLKIQRSMPLVALGILTPSMVSVVLLLTTFWMKAGNSTRTSISTTSMLVCSWSLFTIGRMLPISGSTTPIIVEYVTMSLILSLIASLQTVSMSVLSRCLKTPPVAYATIISKIPNWSLVLLGLRPEPDSNINLDQAFLFSELADSEGKNSKETEDVNNSTSEQTAKVKCLWEKHIMFFDRVGFYVFGIIILLLITSVMSTE